MAGDGTQSEACAGRLMRSLHDHARVIGCDATTYIIIQMYRSTPALPDDPDILQRMLREVVPKLQAENEELWLLVQRLLRHRFGPRSEKA